MGSNVSKKEANVHSVSIGNRYNKTILVKYDFQEKFVTLEEFAIKGGVTAAGFGAEGGGRQKKQYDWNKINIQFTPIRPGKFLYRKVPNEDVFLSIITDDGDVIVNTWYVSEKSNFVVTEDMDLMEADDKDPLKVHKDFVKICQEPRATDYFEDKKRDSSTKQQPVTRRLDITQIKAEKSASLDVKVSIGDDDCYIDSLAVTSNGTLLLADYQNKNIKSVSPDNNILSVLQMPNRPYKLIALDSTTAVTNSDSRNLYIIHISDPTALTIKKEIQLRFQVCAVAKYSSDLIVTCFTEPASTKLIDFSGKELWSISKDESEKDLFKLPCGIVLSKIDNKDTAIVIDYIKETITLLDAKNGRLMRVINVDENAPIHITIDNDCNVYISYLNSDEIRVWSRDFKSNRILLSKKDLAMVPTAIVYSEATDSIYIPYHTGIDCFRLK